MKKILLFFGVLSLMLQGQDKIFDQQIHEISRDIAQALEQEIEKRSGRKNVVIKLQTKQEKQKIFFSLTRRCTRDTFFSLFISKQQQNVLVNGRFFSLAEKDAVLQVLEKYLVSLQVKYQLQYGPVGYGVISRSCVDLYVEPQEKRGGNLASQLHYGIPVLLLDASSDKRFFLVQGTMDGYLGWLKADSFTFISESSWKSWKKSSKYYLTEKSVDPLLFVGTPLVREGNLAWLFPGNSALPVTKSKSTTDVDSLMKTARRFLHSGDLGPIEYLWGGSRVPALDCSGYTQLVFRLNGVLLPRDADQQLQFGELISSIKDMQGGDLIFFSKHGRHPTHVGIYLGENLFIHCSPKGEYGVKINNIEGKTDYERYLKKVYFGGCRILR